MSTQTALGILKIYASLATLGAGYFALEGLDLRGAETLLAYLMFYALILLAGLGLADAVVNDLMSADYSLPEVTHTKYLAFVALSGVNISLLYPELLALNSGLKPVFYGFNAAVAAGVAVLDLRERHRRAYAETFDNCVPASQDS